MADDLADPRPTTALPTAGTEAPGAGTPGGGDQRPSGVDSWGPTTEHVGTEHGRNPPARPDEQTPTDELPLRRRVVRRVKRGEQGVAVKDVARTIEAKVPADFRIAIGCAVVAIAAVVVQRVLFDPQSTDLVTKLVGYGLALVFLIFGILCVRSAANESARLSTARGGRTAAQAIRVTILLVGYVLVALVTLGMLDVNLGNLLVGGAVTGVVIGIAAQQALGNVFAGLVLLFSRPYVPGEAIRVNTGSLGGPHDGVVVSVGLTYTVLMTDQGPLNIPNSGLLASAIGPQPPDPEPESTPDPDGPPVDAAVPMATAPPGSAPPVSAPPVSAPPGSAPPARGGAPTGMPPG